MLKQNQQKQGDHMKWRIILSLLRLLLNGKGVLDNMQILVEIIAAILDRINDDETARNFTRDLGAMLSSFIPGDKIEPELVVFLDLLKEGLLEENSDNE